MQVVSCPQDLLKSRLQMQMLVTRPPPATSHPQLRRARASPSTFLNSKLNSKLRKQVVAPGGGALGARSALLGSLPPVASPIFPRCW